MRKSSKLLAFVLALAMLLSLGCSAFADDENPDDTTWAVFIYMCGSDLESDDGDATDNLIALTEAENDENIIYLIEAGGARSWNNTMFEDGGIGRYIMYQGSIYEDDESPVTDTDMGEASTLTNFLNWGLDYVEDGMRTALILWNHGGGSISGVCFDELNDYNSLSLTDVGSALASVSGRMGKKFDVIGFDACLMGTLETANVLAPYADYMFASQETEPGYGWDYTGGFSYLGAHPNATGAEWGEALAKSYYNYIASEEAGEDNVTFSITDLSKISAVNSALDAVAKEVYENQNQQVNGMTLRQWFQRAGYVADNFGGNNATDGYTNMIDLKTFMETLQDVIPAAKNVVSALNDAVVFSINGKFHANAGGLSVFYPLSVDDGSMEMSIFREVATSSYYLAMVNLAAYGYDMGVSAPVSTPAPAATAAPSATTETVTAGGNQGSTSDADCPLNIHALYLDEYGTYTVSFNNMGNLATASCMLIWYDGDEAILLGEDDNVAIDYENGFIYDAFDGSWMTLNDNLLPLNLVSQTEEMSFYSCPILLNGEETSLRLTYNWKTGEIGVLGTWDGINGTTGMAARDCVPLNFGDKIEILYYYSSGDGIETISSDPVIYAGSLNLQYEMLPAGSYDYSFVLYDIYGNSWSTDSVTFYVNDDGSIGY